VFKQLRDEGVIANVHVLNKVVVLWSEPGCQKQRMHADWSINLDNFKLKPVGILFAVDNNAMLHVKPPDGGKDIILTFDQGEAVVFHGDTVHAGAAYKERHVRLHIYGDIDEKFFMRPENTTLYDSSESDSEGAS